MPKFLMEPGDFSETMCTFMISPTADLIFFKRRRKYLGGKGTMGGAAQGRTRKPLCMYPHCAQCLPRNTRGHFLGAREDRPPRDIARARS